MNIVLQFSSKVIDWAKSQRVETGHFSPIVLDRQGNVPRLSPAVKVQRPSAVVRQSSDSPLSDVRFSIITNTIRSQTQSPFATIQGLEDVSFESTTCSAKRVERKREVKQ